MKLGGNKETNRAPETDRQREILEEEVSPGIIKQIIGRFETADANEPDPKLISHVYLVRLKQSPQIAAEIAAMKWVNFNDSETKLAPSTNDIVIPWCEQNSSVTLYF